MSESLRSFACSPGGAIASGRQRLGTLFLMLAAAMLAASAWCWWSGRILPGFLSLGVVFVVWTAWSLTADLDELGLELDRAGAAVRIRTRSRTIELPSAALRARRLAPDETDHLTRLATFGGVTVATGGFESHRLGEFQLYATDLTHAVLLESDDDRVVVTPDDPAAFLSALGAASETASRSKG